MKNLNCGLLGEKLGHSYSKQIHACFAPYSYKLYEADRATAEKMIKSEEFDGLNVTIPYKELAYSLCDELDEFAAAAKSVNTVIHRGGRTLGYNTDVFGFISMVKSSGIELKDKNVIILGSGGTSKTAQVAARTVGAKSITVVSRAGEVNYDNVYGLSDTEIIVNTTPVGMYPKVGVAPIDISRFKKCEGLVEVIYNPAKTRLIFDAEACGIKWVSGLFMLAAQAFRAAEIFTGESLDSSLIEAAAARVAAGMRNIILIGMPGSGKSTVAQALARLTLREAIDTDEVIRARYGAPADIIKTEGEEHFRRIETEVIAELGAKSSLIISTGGGAVEREENLALLSQNGRIYLIERDIENLATEGRPLSKDIYALYEKRKPKYDRFADVRVTNNGTPEQCAEKILDSAF